MLNALHDRVSFFILLVSVWLQKEQLRVSDAIRDGNLRPSGLSVCDARAVITTVIKGAESTLGWLRSLPRMVVQTAATAETSQLISYKFLELVYSTTLLTSELSAYPLHAALFTGKRE